MLVCAVERTVLKFCKNLSVIWLRDSFVVHSTTYCVLWWIEWL